MLFAAILMRVFDVSGNLMSLGALDFGLIVDGAVVMVENAVRRRAEAQHAGAKESPEKTILDACVEVGRPVVFAVAIIMIVYLPILSLQGIEGKMFKPMALTVIFALLGSLILSLTYVPAALTFVLRGHVAEKESFLIRYARRWYRPALDFMTRWRAQALGGRHRRSSSSAPSCSRSSARSSSRGSTRARSPSRSGGCRASRSRSPSRTRRRPSRCCAASPR